MGEAERRLSGEHDVVGWRA